MKNLCFVLIVSFLTIVANIHIGSTVLAADIIPKEDFIRITDQALDALDEIETVFSDSESTKYEAKKSFKKFDTAMKKYDRHIKSWPSGIQGQIAWYMTSARLSYDMVLIEGTHGEKHKEAEAATRNARELFIKYKIQSKVKKRGD